MWIFSIHIWGLLALLACLGSAERTFTLRYNNLPLSHRPLTSPVNSTDLQQDYADLFSLSVISGFEAVLENDNADVVVRFRTAETGFVPSIQPLSLAAMSASSGLFPEQELLLELKRICISDNPSCMVPLSTPCSTVNCKNGGACSILPELTAQCVCPDSFSGPSCENDELTTKASTEVIYISMGAGAAIAMLVIIWALVSNRRPYIPSGHKPTKGKRVKDLDGERDEARPPRRSRDAILDVSGAEAMSEVEVFRTREVIAERPSRSKTFNQKPPDDKVYRASDVRNSLHGSSLHGERYSKMNVSVSVGQEGGVELAFSDQDVSTKRRKSYERMAFSKDTPSPLTSLGGSDYTSPDVYFHDEEAPPPRPPKSPRLEKQSLSLDEPAPPRPHKPPSLRPEMLSAQTLKPDEEMQPAVLLRRQAGAPPKPPRPSSTVVRQAKDPGLANLVLNLRGQPEDTEEMPVTLRGRRVIEEISYDDIENLSSYEDEDLPPPKPSLPHTRQPELLPMSKVVIDEGEDTPPPKPALHLPEEVLPPKPPLPGREYQADDMPPPRPPKTRRVESPPKPTMPARPVESQADRGRTLTLSGLPNHESTTDDIEYSDDGSASEEESIPGPHDQATTGSVFIVQRVDLRTNGRKPHGRVWSVDSHSVV